MLQLLYDAIHSEYGVVVETPDPVELRTRLYPLRKDRPELACLSLVISPTNPTGELWIVKRPTDGKE